MDSEDQEKRDAELGYSVRGEREVRLREWFSLREQGEGPRDFPKLINRLRVKKWAKANPGKRLAIANRYARRPDVQARSLELDKKRRRKRHRQRGQVFVCELDYCRAEFCRMPCIKGPRPRFCSEIHGLIARNRAQRAAAGVELRTCGVCRKKGHNRRGCADLRLGTPPPSTPTGRPTSEGEG